MNGHNGLDLKAYTWQPIYCSQNGEVTEATHDSDGGIYVSIETEIKGRYWRHRYKHLMAFRVNKGQKIKTGQLLGWAGDTGRATGVHLHFDLKELDVTGRIKNYNNGYFGAVDPTEYLSNIPAIKISYFNLALEKAAEAVNKIFEYLRNRST